MHVNNERKTLVVVVGGGFEDAGQLLRVGMMYQDGEDCFAKPTHVLNHGHLTVKMAMVKHPLPLSRSNCEQTDCSVIPVILSHFTPSHHFFFVLTCRHMQQKPDLGEQVLYWVFRIHPTHFVIDG